MTDISRRAFLRFGFCAAATAATLPSRLLASGSGIYARRDGARELSFYHTHTGESARIAYYENGKYVPDALRALNHLLRDWRTNDVHSLDPALFDQLHRLQRSVDADGAYHVICGYRSPRTNAMLHEHSSGVAKHSLHMEGRAIDICLPGKSLSYLHQAALDMQAGGVGYYPSSGFIHIDTGRLRRWG